MKRRIAAVLLAVAVFTAIAMPVALAAPDWVYSEDGGTGLLLYSPGEGQRLYVKDDMALAFDIIMKGHIETDVKLVKRYEPEVTVKAFDVLEAKKPDGTDRYSINLDISDVPEGSYFLVFEITAEDGVKLSEKRTVFITAGRWDYNEEAGTWHYYMGGSYVQNDWEYIAEHWYHFNGTGAMETRWQKLDGKWYWFGENGEMRTGWQKINNKWYCFNNDGTMFANAWIKIDSKWYMVDKDGVMQTGWQKDRGNWYYLDTTTGAMQTGWLQLGDKWYYLGGNGVMRTGTHTIDGKKYTFSNSGAMAK